MNKILIISKDFPPFAAQGSSMRVLKFVKYLEQFGWELTIICEKTEKNEDSTLLDELPNNNRVFAFPSNSPQKKKGFYKKELRNNNNLSIRTKVWYFLFRSIIYNSITIYETLFLAPDKHKYWANNIFNEVLKLHYQSNFNLILASGHPLVNKGISKKSEYFNQISCLFCNIINQ